MCMYLLTFRLVFRTHDEIKLVQLYAKKGGLYGNVIIIMFWIIYYINIILLKYLKFKKWFTIIFFSVLEFLVINGN